MAPLATLCGVRATRLIALITAVATLGAVAPAAAQDPLQDFRKNGSINPCNYTPGQLRNGLNGLPPDVQQYAPGLADQLAAGRGLCGGGGGSAPQGSPQAVLPVAPGGGPPTAGPTAAPEPRILTPPAPKAQAKAVELKDVATPKVGVAATGADTPAWLLPLLVALSLGAILATLLRFSGWSPERFTRPLGAAFSEAGGRTSDALTEVWESVRLGR